MTCSSSRSERLNGGSPDRCIRCRRVTQQYVVRVRVPGVRERREGGPTLSAARVHFGDELLERLVTRACPPIDAWRHYPPSSSVCVHPRRILNNIRHFRNRVFHHERIGAGQTFGPNFQLLVDAIGWINPEMARARAGATRFDIAVT